MIPTAATETRRQSADLLRQPGPANPATRTAPGACEARSARICCNDQVEGLWRKARWTRPCGCCGQPSRRGGTGDPRGWKARELLRHVGKQRGRLVVAGTARSPPTTRVTAHCASPERAVKSPDHPENLRAGRKRRGCHVANVEQARRPGRSQPGRRAVELHVWPLTPRKQVPACPKTVWEPGARPGRASS
jgi:hypothetical protein